MDFIFNINNAPEPELNNKDLEDVLSLLETHFEDWQNFYNLYKIYAPPPNKNQGQIQAWFKELQAAFIKIVEQYNNKVNKFADIVEIEGDTDNLVEEMMAKLNKNIKSTKEKKSSNDKDSMMWG
jgi:hydroxymethylpyrimidine pyrophosphatase-like HAD family hydrolase